MKILKIISITAAIQLVLLVFNLVTLKSLNHHYAVEDYASYVFFFLVYNMLGQLIAPGLEAYYQKLGAKLGVNEIADVSKRLLRRIILIGPLIFFTLYILSYFISYIPLSVMFLCYFGSFSAYYNLLISLLKGMQMIYTIRLLVTVDSLLILLSVHFGGVKSIDIFIVLCLIVLVKLLLILSVHLYIFMFALQKSFKNKEHGSLITDFELERKRYLFLGYYSVVLSRLDKLIIATQGADALAFLGAINAIVVKVRDNLKAFLEWFTLKFVDLDKQSSRLLAQRLIFWGLLFSLPIILGIITYSDEIVFYIFGKDFSPIVVWINVGIFSIPLLICIFVLKCHDQLASDGAMARSSGYIKQAVFLIMLIVLLPKLSFGAPIAALVLSEIITLTFVICVTILKRKDI